MPTEKPKDFKGTLRKLMHYLGAYKIAIAVVMVVAVGATVFNILGPKIMGMATTELFNGVMAKIAGTGTGPDFAAIGNILLFLLGLYLIAAILQFIEGWIMAGIANKISYRMRRDIDEKILRLPFSYYDRESLGNVMSRITNDVDAIQQNFSSSLTQIITSIVTLVGITIMMFSISWILTLAS
jgi:ATP-binding cassette subfamily B protein